MSGANMVSLRIISDIIREFSVNSLVVAVFIFYVGNNTVNRVQDRNIYFKRRLEFREKLRKHCINTTNELLVSASPVFLTGRDFRFGSYLFRRDKKISKDLRNIYDLGIKIMDKKGKLNIGDKSLVGGDFNNLKQNFEKAENDFWKHSDKYV
jgi:hypothetical protein